MKGFLELVAVKKKNKIQQSHISWINGENAVIDGKAF